MTFVNQKQSFYLSGGQDYSALSVYLPELHVLFSKLVKKYEGMIDHAQFSYTCIHNLKGHCHAIWQLYKKLEAAFTSIVNEFQN